jgi:hypothetical protein
MREYIYICTYIHTYIYMYIYIHTRTRDEYIYSRLCMLNVYTCVCVYIYIYIYTHTHIHTHTYTRGLARARRCCQPPVCLSLSRLHGQPSPGANISVSNVRVCIYASVFRHAYPCRTLVVGIVKQFAFKLSPSNSQTKSLRPHVSHA